MVFMAPMMVVVGGTATTSLEATLITSPERFAVLESNWRGPLSLEPGEMGILSSLWGILVMFFPVDGPFFISLT
jgi:hypothetical protein